MYTWNKPGLSKQTKNLQYAINSSYGENTGMNLNVNCKYFIRNSVVDSVVAIFVAAFTDESFSQSLFHHVFS